MMDSSSSSDATNSSSKMRKKRADQAIYRPRALRDTKLSSKSSEAEVDNKTVASNKGKSLQNNSSELKNGKHSSSTNIPNESKKRLKQDGNICNASQKEMNKNRSDIIVSSSKKQNDIQPKTENLSHKNSTSLPHNEIINWDVNDSHAKSNFRVVTHDESYPDAKPHSLEVNSECTKKYDKVSPIFLQDEEIETDTKDIAPSVAHETVKVPQSDESIPKIDIKFNEKPSKEWIESEIICAKETDKPEFLKKSEHFDTVSIKQSNQYKNRAVRPSSVKNKRYTDFVDKSSYIDPHKTVENSSKSHKKIHQVKNESKHSKVSFSTDSNFEDHKSSRLNSNRSAIKSESGHQFKDKYHSTNNTNDENYSKNTQVSKVSIQKRKCISDGHSKNGNNHNLNDKEVIPNKSSESATVSDDKLRNSSTVNSTHSNTSSNSKSASSINGSRKVFLEMKFKDVSDEDSFLSTNEKNVKSPESKEITTSDSESPKHPETFYCPSYEQNLQQYLNKVQNSNASKLPSKELPVMRQQPGAGMIRIPKVAPVTRQLFNPADPSKPILVTLPSPQTVASKVNAPSNASQFARSAAPKKQVSVNEEDDLHCQLFDSESNEDFAIYLKRIRSAEAKISYFIKNHMIPSHFQQIMELRVQLQNYYLTLFRFRRLKYICDKNLAVSLWNSLYYGIIQKLREYMSWPNQCDEEIDFKNRSLSTLLMLVQEGHKFYQGLIWNLEEDYEFKIADIVLNDCVKSSFTGTRLLALESAQYFIICLGDLSRYRYQNVGSCQLPFYVLPPFRWYNLASCILPQKRRPYHQLAVFQHFMKRPLDVYFYYVRSIMCGELNDRNALLGFFHEIDCKFKQCLTEYHINLDDYCTAKRVKADLSEVTIRGSGLHREVWIKPDGVSTKRNTVSKCEEENPITKLQNSLSPAELRTQFLLFYLRCHGLLFTKISMEQFSSCCQRMLLLFTAVLSSPHTSLSSTHLTQIVTLNMFAVQNTQLQDESLGKGLRSLIQECALILSQEMFGRLAQRTAAILPYNINTNINISDDGCEDMSAEIAEDSSKTDLGAGVYRVYKYESLMGRDGNSSYELFEYLFLLKNIDTMAMTRRISQRERLLKPAAAVLIPALKIWCDYLLYHSDVYNPTANSSDYNTPGYNCWSSVAELATLLKSLTAPDVPFVPHSQDTEALHPLILDEDTFLSGFEILSTTQRIPPMYTPDKHSVARGCDWVRVQTLQTVLCRFLCGLDPPILRLHKNSLGKEFLLPVLRNEEENAESGHSGDQTPIDSEQEIQSSSEDELEEQMSRLSVSEEREEVNETERCMHQLLLLKKTMDDNKKKMKKHRYDNKLEVTVEMRVKPLYIVPDTNCFIDSVAFFREYFVSSSPFVLLVPVVVVKELEGISKDSNQSPVKGGQTKGQLAVEARQFLKSKSHNIRTVTTQGSILPSVGYTESVDSNEDMNNDDKIIKCCSYFCQTIQSRSNYEEGIVEVQCEAVLLTQDRNMAIKAHSANVPIMSIRQFTHWVVGGADNHHSTDEELEERRSGRGKRGGRRGDGGRRGGSRGGDGGSRGGDGGSRGRDGGSRGRDGGSRGRDGGSRGRDGGSIGRDGGSRGRDGGSRGRDGGNRRGDGGNRRGDRGNTRGGDGGRRGRDGGRPVEYGGSRGDRRGSSHRRGGSTDRDSGRCFRNTLPDEREKEELERGGDAYRAKSKEVPDRQRGGQRRGARHIRRSMYK